MQSKVETTAMIRTCQERAAIVTVRGRDLAGSGRPWPSTALLAIGSGHGRRHWPLGGGADRARVPRAPSKSPQAPARQQSQESVAAAQEISRFRQENGLGPVVSDAQLVAAARTQADAMARAGVMSHDIGGSFASRIRKAGIQAGSASENVAMGQASLRRPWNRGRRRRGIAATC